MFCDEVLLSEEALDDLDRHDSRRTAVARNTTTVSTGTRVNRKILVGTPVLLVLVSERQSISHIPLRLINIV